MSRRGGAALVGLFVVYLIALVWIVLWKLEVPWIGDAAVRSRPVKLVPFIASGDAGASAPAEVLINVALFVPFGVYLGLLVPGWRWWRAAAGCAGASLLLEVTQHLISTGSFDSTDIIVNTAGGLGGLALIALVRRLAGDRTVEVMTLLCIIATISLFLAIAVFTALPLHYGPQRDVIVSSWL